MFPRNYLYPLDMLQIRLRVGNFCRKDPFRRDFSPQNILHISSILNGRYLKKKTKEAKSGSEEVEKSDVENKLRQNKSVNGDMFHRTGDVIVGIIGGGIECVYAAVLLKQSRLVGRVHVVDAKDALKGAVLDINHIDTAPKVKYYNKEHTKQALKDVNVIALMDEVTPDTSRADICSQFDAAFKYVRDVTEIIVHHCPRALVAVMVRPVSATLPMISEIYRCAGRWDPCKIIGSVAIESMRMEAMTANLLDLNPAFLTVPMVAGCDSSTVVPLLSCARPTNHFTGEQREFLLHCLRTVDKEIANTESKVPTLSTGVAAAKFILTLVSGLSGLKNIVACAYVCSNVLPGCRFFTSELQFGPAGVLKNFGLPKASPIEITLIQQAIPLINENAELGTKTLRI